MTDLSALFQPLTIRGLTLPNRIVMSPMTREFSPGGVPGEDVAGYYGRRAEGEAGLIVTEGVGIDHPAAVDKDRIPVLYGEAALAGWRRVTDAVHEAGGRIIPQLWHQGVMKDPGVGRNGHVPACRPSGVWGTRGMTALDEELIARLSEPGAPMTESDIADVVAAYGRSAANAAAVGFDGIAIHGAHGYLPDAFLWADTNRRTDRWGGDRAARTCFAVELVRAIRAAIGPEKPIVFRFSQWKQQDFKARLADTPAELGEILGPIADAGVDVFDASTRYFDTPAFPDSPLNLAGWAKKLTGRLAMTVGGVGLDKGMYDTVKEGGRTTLNLDPLVARLSAGEFDLVGVGRSILNDPAWARKLRTGEPLAPFDRAALERLT
jgi:2,4-dienoyl-CoA reductase-like NADH-dependent reductase (Old Yellow Enzyme family)